MRRAGVIVPSNSEWAAPVVLVPKKDNSVRFCVDYRGLNAISQVDAYPMPRIEDIFDEMGDAEFITTLDLACGYWQIPMEKTSQPKTAFCDVVWLVSIHGDAVWPSRRSCYISTSNGQGAVRHGFLIDVH